MVTVNARALIVTVFGRITIHLYLYRDPDCPTRTRSLNESDLNGPARAQDFALP